MRQFEWNKEHTKIRVYSTISEGYITGWMTIDEMKRDPEFKDYRKTIEKILEIDKLRSNHDKEK